MIGSRLDAGGTIVSSVIIRGQTVRPIKVDWRLTERDGVYKISDVIIDGLSMAVTGRSELEGVAERNGGQPQAILAVMRQEMRQRCSALDHLIVRQAAILLKVLQQG